MNEFIMFLLILLLSIFSFLLGANRGKNGFFNDGFLIINDSNPEEVKMILDVKEGVEKIKNKKVMQLRVVLSKPNDLA